MHSALRIGLWVLAVTLLLVTGIFLYLRNADLSVYQEPIEQVLSDIVGHEVRIAGLFRLEFGGLTTLTAEQVSITNTHLADDPVLLRIGHVSTTVDLWSLINGPVIIPVLQIRDIDVRLHRDAASNSNWDTGRPARPGGGGEAFDANRIAVELLQVEEFRFSLTDPSRRRPLNLSIEQLAVAPDQDRMLELDLAGAINEFPLAAQGQLGPWENLLTGTELSADMSLTLGQVALNINGYVADLGDLEGVDLVLDLTGPSIDRVAAVLGWPPFAQGEFDIDGRILKVDDVNQVRLEGHFGEIEVFAGGETDYLRNPRRSTIDFRVAGPDTQYVAELFGIRGARPVPFQVAGELNQEESRLSFADTLAVLGENRLEIDGWVDFSARWPDIDMSVRASGPDLSEVGPLMQVSNVPAEAFEIDGNVQKLGATWRFDALRATLGENEVLADGFLQAGGSDDSGISFQASGPDISFLQPMTGLRGLPERPYLVSGRVIPDRIGVRLIDASGAFGENRLSLDGVVSTQPGLAGTRLDVQAAGPDLTNIALLADLSFLPAGAFDARGQLNVEDGRLNIESARAEVAGISASASGSVGLTVNAGEFDLDIAAEGPDLAILMQFDWLQRMAGQPFNVAGRVAQRRDRYELTDVDVSIGNLRLGADGRIAGDVESFDLAFSGTSPDLRVIAEVFEVDELPDGAFVASGRVEKSDTEIEFRDMDLRIGDFSIVADGTLSGAPMSNASDFTFSISAPDLRQLGVPFGLAMLPSKTISLSGEVNGVPSGFAVEQIVARIGNNDIAAGFTADLRAKPTIIGEVTATYLDLKSALASTEEPRIEIDEAPREFFFSNEPIDLAWLDAVNLDVKADIGTLMLQAADMYDFRMGINLRDGALDVTPFTFRDVGGGLDGRLQVAPLDGAYLLDAELKLEGVRIGILAGDEQERTSLPPFNGSIALTGTGNSIHEILAGSNGSIALRQGEGRIRDLASSALFGDVVLEVLRTLNPQQQKETFTAVDCAFYDIDIESGVAQIDNVAMQTDKLTILTFGGANLADESLNLSLRATPREGIGISFAGVANSFLKLGGTFLEPRLEIDTKATVTTGGVAVATGGLSLLAKGVWDRMSAANDICAESVVEPE